MSDWRESRIGDEVELAYGKSLPAHTRERGGFKVYGSNGCVGSHSTSLVPGPGIVVGRKGTVGKVIYSRGDFWPIDTTYYVINKNNHNWRFLYHLLSCVGLDELNSHSAIPGLNREIAYSIPIILPGEVEQERIASVLDIIERGEQLEALAIEQTEELNSCATRMLFRCGLRGEVQKETEIGLLPKSWGEIELGELCDIVSGGTPRKSVSKYWGGNIPWVSGKDLKAPSLSDAIDHVTDSGVQAGTRLVPRGSVLLLVRGMGLAKDLPVAVIDRPMAFNQDLKALVPRRDCLGSFVRSAIYACKERMLGRVVTSAHGTMTLNLNDVETFRIPFPSDSTEADEIVEVLDAIHRKIELHSRRREVLNDLFKVLLGELLTGEIRVRDLELPQGTP